MNTEELQIVMNTLQSLGSDGKAAFIWWLVFDKLLPALVGFVAIITAGFIAKFALSTLKCYNYLCNVRDRLGIGNPGNNMYSSEYLQTTQAVDRLLSEAGK